MKQDFEKQIAKLKEENEKLHEQHVKQCAIRSYRHKVKSIELNKVGLCAYDNKRYLLNDVDSLAYGHVGISSAVSAVSVVSAEDSAEDSADSSAANGV